MLVWEGKREGRSGHVGSKCFFGVRRGNVMDCVGGKGIVYGGKGTWLACVRLLLLMLRWERGGEVPATLDGGAIMPSTLPVTVPCPDRSTTLLVTVPWPERSR